jgi:hypothetical protein
VYYPRRQERLAAVYGSSIFTIFALSSRDSTGGCRVNAHGMPLEKTPGYCDIKTGTGRVRLFKSHAKQWHIEYGDDKYKHGKYGTHNPLRTRVVRQGIHFSANMVLWECRTTKASTELPWGTFEPLDDFLPWPIRNNAAEVAHGGGVVSLRDRWYELTEDFSSRSLTKEKDKLPAFSGLASSFRESFKLDLYLAGMWRSHMPSGLLWKTTPEIDWSLHSAFNHGGRWNIEHQAGHGLQ